MAWISGRCSMSLDGSSRGKRWRPLGQLVEKPFHVRLSGVLSSRSSYSLSRLLSKACFLVDFFVTSMTLSGEATHMIQCHLTAEQDPAWLFLDVDVFIVWVSVINQSQALLCSASQRFLSPQRVQNPYCTLREESKGIREASGLVINHVPLSPTSAISVLNHDAGAGGSKHLSPISAGSLCGATMGDTRGSWKAAEERRDSPFSVGLRLLSPPPAPQLWCFICLVPVSMFS